jgi:hypothetical protein
MEQMTKIVLSTVTAMTITIGANAADTFFNYKKELGVGVTYIDRSSNDWGSNNYGLNFNGKLMKSFSETIAMGITVNFDYNPSVQLTSQTSNPTEYSVDFLPTVTYIINNKVDVSAMLGYEYGKYKADWGDWDTKGFSYGVAASYAIATQVRANISALRTNMDFTSNTGRDETAQTMRYTIGIGYNF